MNGNISSPEPSLPGNRHVPDDQDIGWRSDNSRFGAHRFKKFTDKAMGVSITIAGLTVIAAMLAMLFLMVREAAPLFMPARQKQTDAIGLPYGVDHSAVMALSVASDLLYRTRVVGILLSDGRYGFATVGEGASDGFRLSSLPGLSSGASIKYVEDQGDGKFSILWNDNTASLLSFSVDFRTGMNGEIIAEARAERLLDLSWDVARGEPLFAMLRGDASAYAATAVYADGRVLEQRRKQPRGLNATRKSSVAGRETLLEFGGTPVAAALNHVGSQLYIGTDGGDIVSVEFPGDTDRTTEWDIVPAFQDGRAVTSLSFLSGGFAVAAGDAGGGTSVWFPRREGGEFRLRRSAFWKGNGGGIRQIVASPRSRGLFSLQNTGTVNWLYSTTGDALLDISTTAARTVAMTTNNRGDTLLLLHADATLTCHRLDSSHPEAGLSGFFRPLLYEGYEEPAFVWQSTGSDSAEIKLSLAPLLWGSVKGALYALLFAGPVALSAAMYLSQFARASWRARLKPAVEMLAAVPSVVIGFLAALWFAPFLERHVRFIIGDGQYDQRNSLVIAIAMGFAVIPIIFSLAEDAISAVPPSLSAASLALGASQWQTVWRVVLPSASPGIFTAVMLGFGRAVGETMIVLMAAGNTPIISLSPFNGMRTLSANIAVEMPEAPIGGTLYRTLFLCALLLFALTLIINAVAEVFRNRLRRKYGRL